MKVTILKITRRLIRKIIKFIEARYGLKCGFTINWFALDTKRWQVISLHSKNGNKGNVLLSYRVEPFLPDCESLCAKHSLYSECYQMAKTFLDKGYNVDVIDWLNDRFIPEKNYSFFIDIYTNLERLEKHINRDCIKIFHIVRAHWLFQNKAEYVRINELKKRKGVAIKPRRQMAESSAIEIADFVTGLGNEFTMSTYSYAQKPIYCVPVTPCATFPWPEDKDFGKCNKEFLWFGSEGLVHKGLDLVLEAFKQMPEYSLTVCGPINKEKDFESLYFKELYQTLNINTVGWVDVTGDKFNEIRHTCLGLILPSCSEGSSGCAVQCMHAGMIPIISYQCGVDVREDYGIILKKCSIEEIKRTVQSLSELPSKKLKEMSKNAWNFARDYHTIEKYSQKYEEAINIILENTCDKET